LRRENSAKNGARPLQARYRALEDEPLRGIIEYRAIAVGNASQDGHDGWQHDRSGFFHSRRWVNRLRCDDLTIRVRQGSVNRNRISDSA
jgi:hypothetical protein